MSEFFGRRWKEKPQFEGFADEIYAAFACEAQPGEMLLLNKTEPKCSAKLFKWRMQFLADNMDRHQIVKIYTVLKTKLIGKNPSEHWAALRSLSFIGWDGKSPTEQKELKRKTMKLYAAVHYGPQKMY